MSCVIFDNKHYIYRITNLVNNKIYIGKTGRTIQERYEEHLRCSKFDERPLYKAMRKYGVDNFIVEEIEQCRNNDEANRREIYWIKEYNSYIDFTNSNGYNCTLGGDGALSLEVDETKVVKYYKKNYNISKTANFFNISASSTYRILRRHDISIKDYNNEKSICMMKDEKVLKTFKSVVEANKYFNKPKKYSGITNVLNGRAKTACGYNWKYLNCKKTTIIKKPIAMVKDGELIKVFNTHKEAYIYLNKSIKSKNITKVLNGTIKTAYGYEWYYADEFMKNDGKQILMVKNGKIIDTFLTLKDANISLGKKGNSRNISHVLHKRTKTAYGYEWYYANDYIKAA